MVKGIFFQMDEEWYNKIKIFSIDNDILLKEILSESVNLGFPLFLKEYEKNIKEEKEV